MLGSKSRLPHWSPETHSNDSRVLHKDTFVKHGIRGFSVMFRSGSYG